jgi:hypothetical protein
MLGAGYGSPSCHGSGGKRRMEENMPGGEKRPRPAPGQQQQQQPPLQTPPRLTIAAREEAGPEQAQAGVERAPSMKPIYFLGEYVPEEETVIEVNAGGTRFTLPRAALGPLMR